jgi:hypothetical protein
MTRAGLMLQPVGFFDRNPTLDVPASETANPKHGNMCCRAAPAPAESR